MLFQNKYNRYPRTYEKPSGISRVETAGYIPAKIKIESLINAGKRLIESRQEQYDFPPGTKVTGDEQMDPTRRPGLDRVDIDVMEKALKDRIDSKVKEKADSKLLDLERAEQEKAVQALGQQKADS